VAAVEVISELESSGREVYTGAIGFAGPLGGLELSVAIRTFEFSGDGEVWLGVGGGIVADSVAASELDECAAKAEPVIAAIGGRLAWEGSGQGPGPPALGVGGPGLGAAALGSGWPRAPLRIGPRPLPRPDPGAGVFETILVREGRAVALDRHIGRLGASVGALYGRRLPETVGDLVAEAAAGEPAVTSRLRLTARPSGRGLELAIRISGVSPRGGVALRSTTIAGGLGAHKWVDRRLIEACEALAEPEQPVFFDLDGNLLEASRSNVFVVEADGTLVTPPAGRRLLPGVTRGRIIGIAGRLGLVVRVEEVSIERVERATEAFVSGSIGGVAPVEAWDGRGLGPAGPVTLGVAAALDALAGGELVVRGPPGPIRAASGSGGAGARGGDDDRRVARREAATGRVDRVADARE
jgi:para-aminobenzoate synthetase/4-amino-4-deoxychorismate lyase